MSLARKMLLMPVIVLSIILIGCSSNTTTGTGGTGTGGGNETACDKSSDIRGSIVTISQGTSSTLLGKFMLDGTKEQKVQFDKVYTTVTPDTQVFEKQGQECRASSFSALKVGQRVQLRSTGITAQSDPPIIMATEIVILTS